MMIIGVTGGIGTGKTTATSYLVSKGFAHVDADEIGRQLTSDGQEILKTIGREFGCVDNNGLVLDRKALANVVFKNEEKRKRFDEIIHTEMKVEIDKQIAEFRKSEKQGILLDAPLLFETGINDRCDVVILITADMDKRIKRVVQRDNTNIEAVRDRINNQMSDGEKAKFADFVIDNSGEPEDMFTELDNILNYLGF